MSNGSCTAVLDVFRIDGTRVPTADKDHQGSIVNIFNPYRVDYEELPDPPNNRIDIELTWTAGPSGSVATLEENGPGLGKGTIAIFDGNVLLKPAEVQKPVLDLSSYTSPKRFQVEAYKTGVTNLKFVIRASSGGSVLCEDEVRISGISDLPKDGRIVFVNPQATAHTTPYDDYETNAATRVADAVDQLSAEDNIVIAPLRFAETDLILDKSCVIAGLSGYFAANIEVTKYNVERATVLDANQAGRIFEISTDTSDTDSITITGLQAVNGKADNGGAILSDFDALSALRVSYCKFEGNEAVEDSSGSEAQLGLAHAPRLAEASRFDGPGLGFAAAVAKRFGEGKQGNGGAVAWMKPIKGTDVGVDKGVFQARSCEFFKNIGQINGGAVVIMRKPDADVNVTLNKLAKELADPNNDQFSHVVSPLTFFHFCKFYENEANLQGGAIATMREATQPTVKPSSWVSFLLLQEKMTGGSPIYVDACHFKENKQGPYKVLRGLEKLYKFASFPAGGAIYLEGIGCSGSVIQGVKFERNRSLGLDIKASQKGDGGAVAAVFGATVVFRTRVSAKETTRCEFSDNYANDGGGALYATYFSVLRVLDAHFVRNKSGTGGGAVHATSGCVVDVAHCAFVKNKGVTGGAFHGRNSRIDIRKGSVVGSDNEASDRGGGIWMQCSDDSGGRVALAGFKLKFHKFPTSASCPAIVRIYGKSQVAFNEAVRAGGGIEAQRAKDIEDPWIKVKEKLLKVDVKDSEVIFNNLSQADMLYDGASSGLAMTDAWESMVNKPAFNRDLFVATLTKALLAPFPVVGKRWPRPGKFTVARVAAYIASIMLYGLNNLELSRDTITGSTFFANKADLEEKGFSNYQAAVAHPKTVIRHRGDGGLVAVNNKVPGKQRPANLLTPPKK